MSTTYALGPLCHCNASPDDGTNQIAAIDDHVRRVWDEYKLRPSPPATDGEWCRRIHLDLLGRIPTVDELNRFLTSRSRSKRTDLVDLLLFDEQYDDEYARNWSTIWANILVGRNGGNENNSLINREGLLRYLRESLTENKPYDRMVFELVTATGVNTPGSPQFNGAVNYLTMKLGQNAIQATSDTARIFLGLQVQCTQCHNHPFNDWKQNQFWELNAFFRQTVALRRFERGTRNVRAVELANQDFGGEGNTPQEAESYYELRNGLLKAAYPVFVDGTPLSSKSGFLEDVNRRDELGKLIVQSPYLEAAIVNRTWAHFFGYGFTKPVDDMGPHHPPTHPELLSYLSQQLRDRGFDMKQLKKWIVLSEPYGLSSRMTARNQSDDPTLGEPPRFSHFYLRQMSAEELFESLLTATAAHKTRENVDEQQKARDEWLRQFTIAFGTDEGDETTTFNGTIPQTLMMFNGGLMKQATNTSKGSFLWQVIHRRQPPRRQIEQLFLAALARRPGAKELQQANRLLVERQGDTTAALQDVWWAVLNSNEFILNH